MLATVTAALLLTAAPAAPSSTAARPRALVLDLRAVQGVQAGTATILTAVVVDDVSRAGFDVVSQADVSTLLGVERQKQVLGCSEDTGCLAEIGGALGADLVLSGQVGQLGSRYHLALQLLDPKKARVVSRTARFSDQNEDALAVAAQAAVAELVAAAGVDLTPRASASAAAPVATPRPSGPRWRPSKLLAWSTTGAGVLVAAGGAVSLNLAQSRLKEIEDGWQRSDYAAFYDDKSAEARRFQSVGYAAVGTGAVVTGLGVWMIVRSSGAPVALVPDLSPGRAGLVAVGNFQ